MIDRLYDQSPEKAIQLQEQLIEKKVLSPPEELPRSDEQQQFAVPQRKAYKPRKRVYSRQYTGY